MCGQAPDLASLGVGGGGWGGAVHWGTCSEYQGTPSARIYFVFLGVQVAELMCTVAAKGKERRVLIQEPDAF